MERGKLILFPAMGQPAAKQDYDNVSLGCVGSSAGAIVYKSPRFQHLPPQTHRVSNRTLIEPLSSALMEPLFLAPVNQPNFAPANQLVSTLP